MTAKVFLLKSVVFKYNNSDFRIGYSIIVNPSSNRIDMQNSIPQTRLRLHSQVLKIGSFALTYSLLFSYLCPSSLALGADSSSYVSQTNSIEAIAQRRRSEEEIEELPNQFTPNPLLQSEPDPMLPEAPESGILRDDVREELAAELDKLNAEATTLLAGGDMLTAFETWNRELRLRRYLGTGEELAALQRVAAIAWDINQRLQIRWITQRLEEILLEIESEETVNLELLQRLGLTFQQVRAQERSLEVYEQILDIAQEQENAELEEQTLATVAQIHLNWLDYENAAFAYEKLLDFQLEKSLNFDSETEIQIPPATTAIPTQLQSLRQLAFIYDRSGQALKAITAKERLASLYRQEQNLEPVPDIQIEIASDYQELGNFNLASQYYQEAYTLAQSIQQFYSASEALEKLAALYLSQDRKEAALEIYQVQLLMDREFYNVYGMMNTYDRMGQIYSQLEDDLRAKNSFERGLQLARQLGGYREDYFLGKLDKINRRFNR